MIEVKSPSETKAVKEGEADRVYRLLKSRLMECEFVPGQALTEVDPARRCDTSRTPVREACNRLVQVGWILSLRNRGYQVMPVSVNELLATYEYRKLLECFAAEKTAQVVSNEKLAKLRDFVALESDRTAKVGLVILALAEIAGNPMVFAQLKLTLEYVHRLDCLSALKERSWIPHGEILAGLEARRPAEARQAMATHIDYARDRMLRLFAH